MRSAHTLDEVRAAEGALMAQQPEGTLMQRAATGLASVCAGMLGRVYGAKVVLLVGSGNNGGDALFAGAALARRGAGVEAVLLFERVHGPGLAALRAAGGRVMPAARAAAAIGGADLVVDGILGIGGRGGLRGEAVGVASLVAASAAGVVAVDVPSGVDADTGVVDGPAVRADVTVTFGTLKPGLLVDPGASHAGVVRLVDIGLAPLLPVAVISALDASDVAALLPRAGAESDKYRRGVVGVAAGSDQYPGAAVLCVGGALRAAGMVRYTGPSVPTELVHQRWPEVVAGDGRVQAHVVGSGLGTDDAARERLDRVLASDEPAVVDADGTTLLAGEGKLGRAAPTVLTPHAGELARLLGVERADVEARRLEHARAGAEQYAATVLLKGSTTIVATPGGAVRVVSAGTPHLATAGSGDVLAGLIGALLAAGLDGADAAAVGAWLHGIAGRLASRDDSGDRGAPISAFDVLEHLGAAWHVGLMGAGS